MVELVYHGTPTLYPEQSGDVRMGTVRFSQPVRLSSLRVIPDGVECPEGVGETSPGEFTLDVLLNIAPSDPVNALAKTTARIVTSPHALDYALDMPEGTATRLVVLRAPARRITVSIYAHNDGTTPMGAEAEPPGLNVSSPTRLHLPSAEALLAALPKLEVERRQRALASLAVLAQSSLTLETALSSPHVEALQVDGAEAAVASILGLSRGFETAIEPRKALAALISLPSTPWATVYPDTEAPLAVVLHLAEAQAKSSHPCAGAALATTIRRLVAVLETLDERGRSASARLARALPPLAANAVTRGASLTLPKLLDARTVLASLLPVSASIAGGYSCALAARALAQPFISQLPRDDPLRRAWEPLTSITSSPYPVSARTSPLPSVPTLQVNPPDAPAPISPTVVSRISRALDAGSGSMMLAPTPAELLAAIAPGLLNTLSTATQPPLGIPASRAAHGSASDYAGKVYSAHEFRREREMVSGLGVGASSAGRKASRHVDEFGS